MLTGYTKRVNLINFTDSITVTVSAMQQQLHCGQESSPAAPFSEETEEVWHKSRHPHKPTAANHYERVEKASQQHIPALDSRPLRISLISGHKAAVIQHADCSPWNRLADDTGARRHRPTDLRSVLTTRPLETSQLNNINI